MSTDHRSWRCPTCLRQTVSSRSVRARYCPRCAVWCMRLDADREDDEPAPEPRYVIGIDHATGPESVVLFEEHGHFEGFGGEPGKA